MTSDDWWLRPTLLLWALFLIVPSSANAERPLVAVSIPPQAYLVEAVAGDLVEVVVAVPPGASPHAFDPTPRQIARLVQASLYLAIGVEVEARLVPQLQDMAPAILVAGTAATVQHHGHDHDHHATDPHIWLDPGLVVPHVTELVAGLCTVDPDHADTYRCRADTLKAELTALRQELATILQPAQGRDLVVAHPAFGHLATAYGLQQVVVIPGGHEPSPRQLAEAIDRVRTRGARALFVQPQFPITAAQGLARTAGIELVVLDPLAGNYPENMRSMARTIVTYLQ